MKKVLFMLLIASSTLFADSCNYEQEKKLLEGQHLLMNFELKDVDNLMENGSIEEKIEKLKSLKIIHKNLHEISEHLLHSHTDNLKRDNKYEYVLKINDKFGEVKNEK